MFKTVLPEVLTKPEDLVVDLSQTAAFTVRVRKTDYPVTTSLVKAEKTLSIDGGKYTLATDESEYSFTYSIGECGVEDAGQYQIEVSNTFGKVTLPVRLLVKCKPIASSGANTSLLDTCIN